MKILSIDIGIKNLAYCFLETNDVTSECNIIKWDVINLCKETPKCQYIINTKKMKKSCDKKSSLFKDDIFYCKTHAKKMNCLFKTPENTIKGNSKIDDIKSIANNLKLEYAPSVKKNFLKKQVEEYIEKNIFKSVTKHSANDLSLIDIGISIAEKLSYHFNEEINHSSIDKIIIENQISPLANRMKTIQGMVAQYFIMKKITDIHFISAINKLKPFTKEKMNYKERKIAGIKITKQILEYNKVLKNWIQVFSTHKKKDDLADSFLQGLWFLFHKKYITTTDIIAPDIIANKP